MTLQQNRVILYLDVITNITSKTYLVIHTPQGDKMKKSLLLTAIIGLAATTVISCNTTKSMTVGKTAKENSMTQIEKAQALIGTFASGDTEKARSLLAEGYIQHNLAYGTGAEAFVGSVAYLASAPVKTTLKTIRTFEDGGKVFMQTVYNFAGVGEQVAFNIFRFDADGKIAEHWNIMETIAEKSTWQNQNGKF